MNKYNSCSFKKVLKQADIYAMPIQLSYKGKDKFRSTLGGFISVIVLLFLTSLFLYKLQDMIQKDLTSIKKNTLVSISNSHSDPVSLSEKNITMAFMLSNFWGEGSFDDPYYGKFTLTQQRIYMRVNETDGTTYREYFSYLIPFSKCEIGRNFLYANEAEIAQYGIESYYCPDWQNLTIQGNWYSPEYSTIHLQYQRCFDSNCSGDDEFEQWFKQISIQEVIISSYFNVADYEQPIHYFLDDAYVSLQFNRSVIYDTFFKKNQLKLHDELFSIFSDEVKDSFFQRSHSEYFTSDDMYGPGKGVYFLQALKLDKEYDVYERNVYTITGVLQDVGGFYNSLFFIGLILFGRIQKTLFFSDLFTKLYQVELQEDEGAAANPAKTGLVKTFLDEDTEQSPAASSQTSYPSLKTKVLEGKIKEQLSSENIKGRDFLKLLREYLLRRIRLTFSAFNLLTFALSQFFPCFCRSKILHQKSDLKNSKLELYKLGEQRIMKDFDCINLLNRLREVSILASLLLNQQQRFIMKYSKKNILNKYKEDSSDNSEVDLVKKYQKEKNQQKSFRIYKSLVKEQLSAFHTKFDDFDLKILYGLVSHNPLRHFFALDNIGQTKGKIDDDEEEKLDDQPQVKGHTDIKGPDKLPYHYGRSGKDIVTKKKQKNKKVFQPMNNDDSISSVDPSAFTEHMKSNKANLKPKSQINVNLSGSFTDENDKVAFSKFSIKYKKRKTMPKQSKKVQKDAVKVFKDND